MQLNSKQFDSSYPTVFLNFLTDVKQLAKPGLSFSVIFSSIAGYLLGADHFVIAEFALLGIGGMLVVFASNVFNQIIEVNTDALMRRTKYRPLPNKRMKPSTAYLLGLTFGVVGLFLLYRIDPMCSYLGFISLLLYVAIYTPLKKVTPLAVFVGAIPGAIPFMLGWVAATGSFGIECLLLFSIQFFWQFPHFWAIGWLQFEEYQKAGIRLLPMGNKDKKVALQIISYTLCMILVSVLPAFQIIGDLKLHLITAIIILAMGLWMFFYALKLYKHQTNFYAKKLMISSVFYITLAQIAYVTDKFLT